MTDADTAPRPLTRSDAGALLTLIEACDIADVGEPDYTMDDVVDDFGRDTWRGWGVDRPDGALAAYFWVERHPGKPRVEGDVRVHPTADPRLGPRLVALARECAAEVGIVLPMHVFTAAGSRERKWLEAAGGRVARHYWRMTIALPDAPAAEPPVPPPGIAVERPRDEPGDLRVMYDVIETAFHDHFGHAETGFEEWLARQRGGTGPDIGLWWLARVDGEPAAALIGRAWPEQGWVQGLGTLRGFRGRGLARLLLETAFAEFHRRGYRRAGLSVDATNPTGAVALYESVGMKSLYEAILYEVDSIGPSPAGSMMSLSKNV